MNQELTTILKEISLFQGLEESKLEELASISRVKKYKRENTIFYEGEQSDALIIVAEGTVRICKHNSKGDRINIGVFRPYQLLAEAVTLKQALFPASAYCETDVNIISIDMKAFRKTFLEDSKVSSMIIESLLEKIRIIETNIEINVASTAKEKIISFYKKNQTLNLGLKNYEVASLLGISAETFSRNLKQLEKEKVLYKSESGYIIK
jgi:CRP/FNR family transcriptional regulator